MLTALTLTLVARLTSPTTGLAEALGAEAINKGADIRAAATLVRLHRLRDEVDDLNLLAEPYAALLYRGNTDPFVRTLARLLYADVERARGRTTKAAEHLAELGFVTDWWAVGGFDNEGKAGCDTDFGPESGLDLKATYPASNREVGWRKPNAAAADAFVDLGATLQPNHEAVGYALSFVQADAETRAVLSFGVSGGYRLFVNGIKAGSSDRYNSPRPDQHRVAFNLRRGINRVLLKVCHEKGPFGFYARLDRADGQRARPRPVPLAGVPPLERGGPPMPFVLPTVSDVLQQRLKLNPADPALRLDVATVLSHTLAYAESERTVEREAARAAADGPQSVTIQLGAASELRDEFNLRRRALERAIALSPTHPQVRLQLALHELNADHPDRALALVQTLLAEHPRFARASLTKAQALEALGERIAAQQTIEAAFQDVGQIPVVAREAIGAARRQEHLTDAVARARMAMALRFDDVNTRRTLASMLMETGHLPQAIDQLEKALVMDPFDVPSVLRMAEWQAANGATVAADAAFARALALAPDDAEVHERLGKAALHAGQADKAMAAFTTALQLKPQNPPLKELLRALRGGDDHSTPYAYTLADLSADGGASGTDDAVILAEVTAVRVQPNGLASRFNQRVVHVFTERGVEAFRQLPMTYSPDRQEVRILRARVSKADGSVVESFSEQDRNINEPWTGMYYDARARVLTFPSLAPGDTLDLQWRIDDTAQENLLSDFWGDVDTVQSTFVKKQYRYVVEMPPGRALYWNQATLPAWVQTSQTTVDGRSVYRFEASNVAKLVPEPMMPGWAEVATPLHVSTYANWADVGKYYWGLVRDQLTPNDELKKTVEMVLKGIDRKDTRKMVAAIYGFVVTNTRYVALEFGIHGYKPYRVDRVLARRFGDCKDKASLIVAMLGVAGVDARLVLLRMRHLGILPEAPASLSAFNHAIAYVPSLGLYLDGTAEFHGSTELPSADRRAPALVVEPQGVSRFLVTPEAEPATNATTLTLAVSVATDGSASLKGSLTATGQAAPELRRAYQTTTTRVSTFEQQWAQSFPGIAAKEVTVSDTTALDAAATVAFTAQAPRFSEAAGPTLRFFPLGAGRAFTQAMAPLVERKFDVVFSGVWTNRYRMTYSLPEGYVLGEAPPPVRESSPFGEATLTVKAQNGVIAVEADLTLATARVAPADYRAFRAWLLKVDQALSRRLLVTKATSSAQR